MTLPPLPKSMRPYHDVIEGPLFTADQMRDYATAAVAAERERIARRLEQHLGLVGALVADHLRDDEWPNAGLACRTRSG